jgi:hypothetical protein
MRNEFKGLRHYIDIVEAKEQPIDEAGFVDALGNFVKGGANLVGNVAGNVVQGAKDVGTGIANAAGAVGNAVTGAVDAAGNAISGAVAPVVQAAQAGYNTGTGQPAPQQSASPKPNPAKDQAKPAATQAKPAATKGDPAVFKLQQDLIAKGAKIQADGIMGPQTKAAQAKFGGAAPAAAVDTAPVPASANASSSMTGQAPAAALGTSTNNAAGAMAAMGQNASNATANTTGGPTNMGTAGTQAGAGGYAPAQAATTPDNSNVATDDIPFDPTWGGTKAAPDTRTAAEKFLPNFMGGKAAPTAANKNATWNNSQQAAVSNPAGPKLAETAGYDELQRIVSLVHHR